MNDAVILLCGVILLLAVLPMILMSRAFKGAGRRKGEGGSEPGAGKPETFQRQTDSGTFSDSGGDKGK